MKFKCHMCKILSRVHGNGSWDTMTLHCSIILFPVLPCVQQSDWAPFTITRDISRKVDPFKGLKPGKTIVNEPLQRYALG